MTDRRRRNGSGCRSPLGRVLYLSLMFLLTVAAGRSPDIHSSKLFDDWYSNAIGYERAQGVHAQTQTPMLVYVYADWCTTCKQFARDVLADPRVRGRLQQLLPVRLNAEKGAAEASLARALGVRGYPTVFLVQSDAGKRTLRSLDPFVSPQGFLAQLQSDGG